MAVVEFDHVEKTYPGGARAVSDCSLRVENGELMVLVGPSGCGKSTLLRLLAGLETPSRGTLCIGGRVVNDLAPQERNVAMVFQDYALYPHMSVRRNLEFPLRMRKVARAERRRRVDAVAHLLDIRSLLDRLPKQLSGGERQRVAMGRALVREPSVFLLDEPLSNLDAKLRVQVRVEIADLQRRTGTTMIYVTHDQSEAMTLGDRVAVLHDGRLQQIGTPREIYEEPANTFVAGFIGTPPMNLFPTRLSLDPAGRSGVTVGGVVVPLPQDRMPAVVHREDVASAGVRPEHIQLTDGGPGTLPATVEQVEYLGHETLLHVRAGGVGIEDGICLITRLPGTHTLVPGDPVSLALDAAHLHLFDAGGEALTAR
jgi:multiple sugar transport system ATP-binding protein